MGCKLLEQYGEVLLRFLVGAVLSTAISDVYSDLHLEEAKSNWCGSIQYLNERLTSIYYRKPRIHAIYFLENTGNCTT